MRLFDCPGLKGTLLFSGSILILGTSLACNGSPRHFQDAYVELDAAQVSDGSSLNDKGPTEVVAEILVTGCPLWETIDETRTCRAQAPLTVTFEALTSTGVQAYRWDVGETAELPRERSIEHTYQTPGVYDVSLVVAGEFGSFQTTASALITIEPAPLGAFCRRSVNCNTGFCLCNEQQASGLIDCPSVLSGTCTQPCIDQACADGVCMDLRPGLNDNSPSEIPWRVPLCLPSCQTQDDCTRPGFACHELPTYPFSAESEWIRVCAFDLLSDVGEECFDATGMADPSRCEAGTCADLGLRGMCTQTCVADSCPSGSFCAEMSGSGELLCLRRCDDTFPCDDDPLLGCEQEDPAGYHGFELLTTTTPADSFCAPKRCLDDPECGPSGMCDPGLGGFCVTR